MLHRKGKLGLGTAYVEGFRWGLKRGYDFLMEMDADWSHDPRVPARLFIKASRPDGGYGSGKPLLEGEGELW